jgi:hypothetical protein
VKLDERRETKDERTCHPEQSEGSLNTSLRGRSEPATSEAWWWQSREGLN